MIASGVSLLLRGNERLDLAGFTLCVDAIKQLDRSFPAHAGLLVLAVGPMHLSQISERRGFTVLVTDAAANTEGILQIGDTLLVVT
jgi:hypothetical protein